jgi:hypothetical protein
MIATHEFVVPKSIPIILPMWHPPYTLPDYFLSLLFDCPAVFPFLVSDGFTTFTFAGRNTLSKNMYPF